jgi:hypothetical protein
MEPLRSHLRPKGILIFADAPGRWCRNSFVAEKTPQL